MCGRKKKFGMNMQAIVDHHKRFLHISVAHPASTSDYLAYSTMKLFLKLETPGFLAPGVHLFGDNAYVGAPYMATPYKNVRNGPTPYKNVRNGPRDDYNVYHSPVGQNQRRVCVRTVRTEVGNSQEGIVDQNYHQEGKLSLHGPLSSPQLLYRRVVEARRS
jgi:DDE superfamily endonuclease